MIVVRETKLIPIVTQIGIILLLKQLRGQLGNFLHNHLLTNTMSREEITHQLEHSVDLEDRKKVWRFLMEKCSSLTSREPSREDTPHFWGLDPSSASYQKDKRFISQSLPSHVVIDLGHFISYA